MASLTTTSSVLHLLPLLLLLTAADAAIFNITNQCSFPVWAAAVPVGGGAQLDPGQTWTVDMPAGTTTGRVWARTGCYFDGDGNGNCQTGDCFGVLACTSYGQLPHTLAKFALNQFNNDFFDISLVNGFNVPMNFLPADGEPKCKVGPRCAVNITSQCPSQLQAPGGCNHACTVFQQDQYCCTGVSTNNCRPTTYSVFFKNQCPDVYSYPMDDPTSTFTCPGGTNYQVAFCPSS